jgi:hypothetical protein
LSVHFYQTEIYHWINNSYSRSSKITSNLECNGCSISNLNIEVYKLFATHFTLDSNLNINLVILTPDLPGNDPFMTMSETLPLSIYLYFNIGAWLSLHAQLIVDLPLILLFQFDRLSVDLSKVKVTFEVEDSGF